MHRPKINTAFDEHDHQQLVLLAKLNKIKPSEMVRKIVRIYLDGSKSRLRDTDGE